MSLMTMTYQRRYSRLSCRNLTVPRTGRCWRTLTEPTAWNTARAHPPGSAGVRFRAVPGDETDLAEPAVGLEPRITRLPLPPRSGVEGGEHGAEPTQRLLLSGERVAPLPVRVGAAYLFQLGGLHVVANADPADAPRLPALLQRRVVQIAVISEQPRRASFLRACRVGAEFKSAPRRTRSFRHGRLCCTLVDRHTVCAGTASAVAAGYERDRKAGRRERRCGKLAAAAARSSL